MRSSNLVAIAAVAALASLASAPASADAPSGPERALRVLLPAAAGQIEAAFARAAPTWRLASAKIDKDHVVGSACVAEVCHAFELHDAVAGCDALVAGPFCLRWSAAAPAESAALVAALTGAVDAEIWHVIEARPPQPAAVPAAEAPVAPGERSPNAAAPADPQGVDPAAAATAAGAPAGDVPAAAAAATTEPATRAPAQAEPAPTSSAAAEPAADDDGALMRMLFFALLFAVAAGFALTRMRKP